MRAGSDPRRAGGRIAGPGGPHVRKGVVIDTTNAVLLDDCQVAMVEPQRNGVKQLPVVCMKLSGRINRSEDRAEIVFLFEENGVAGIITELSALLTRAGLGEKLQALIEVRLRELLREGAL